MADLFFLIVVRFVANPNHLNWFFFFSSRRRHTTSLCDWSSDVCSSDLYDRSFGHDRGELAEGAVRAEGAVVRLADALAEFGGRGREAGRADGLEELLAAVDEIGRASCRGRV